MGLFILYFVIIISFFTLHREENSCPSMRLCLGAPCSAFFLVQSKAKRVGGGEGGWDFQGNPRCGSVVGWGGEGEDVIPGGCIWHGVQGYGLTKRDVG